MPYTSSHRPGFTLLELILVLAVLSLVAAVSAPRLVRSLGGQTLREEARRFIAAAQYARGEAISTGEPVQLWLQPAEKTYGVRHLNAGDGVGSGRDVSFLLSDDLQFDLGQEKLSLKGELLAHFEPDGSPGAESFSTVAIQEQEGGNRLYISRCATTGRFKLTTELPDPDAKKGMAYAQ